MNFFLSSLAELASQVKRFASQCDNLSSESRRSNLNFYGIPAISGETWTASENKVISLCMEVLGLEFDTSCLQHSHRLGIFRSNKKQTYHREICIV